MPLLSPGTSIAVSAQSTLTVTAYIGGGGQGEVYRVILNPGHREKALKWYTNEALLSSDAFRRNLERLCMSRSPAPAFLWPETVTARRGRHYGYLMQLSDGRPDLGKYFCSDIFTEAVFESWEARLNAALGICEALHALHAAGFCYQDINDGSFMIDPANGHVHICDNDNIVPQGVSTGIRGKARYTAAEVLAGQAPDQISDCMSLAIILYRIFANDHPFEGSNTSGHRRACLSDDEERRLFGPEAVFCHDVSDGSNRPEPDYHPNSLYFWPILSPGLRRAFTEALSKDAIIGRQRYTASRWQRIVRRERAALATCRGGAHDFLLSDAMPAKCPYCGAALTGEIWLHFSQWGSYRLTDGKALYLGSADTPVGRCVLMKYDSPCSLALTNISSTSWTLVTPAFQQISVPPGTTFQLIPGSFIDFGTASAQVTKTV